MIPPLHKARWRPLFFLLTFSLLLVPARHPTGPCTVCPPPSRGQAEPPGFCAPISHLPSCWKTEVSAAPCSPVQTRPRPCVERSTEAVLRPPLSAGLGEGRPVPGPWAQHSQSRKGCGPPWGSRGELLGLEEDVQRHRGILWQLVWAWTLVPAARLPDTPPP